MSDARFDLTGLEPAAERILELVLRIASGDFTARGEVDGKGDTPDAVVVALNMLAESFERENAARRLAEDLLADAVESYDKAPDSYCSCEPGTLRIVKCNQTMSRVLDLATDEIIGRALHDLVMPTSRAPFARALGEIAQGGQPGLVEVELRTATGAVVVADLTGSLRTSERDAPARILVALRDVTATRKLETQLVHAQRMEALGRLAGGVAHDFNNLLFVILSTAELLAADARERPRELERIQIVRDAAERCAALTKDLLAFARQERGQPQAVAIDDVVGKAKGLLAPLLRHETSLDMRLGAPNAAVVIDPGRLGQVLVNLVANARDAMPKGGCVTVITRGVGDASGRSRVELCVRDTGTGISPEVAARIFEPFFTTKPVGRGTGLGLSTVYGIVRRAGGTVSVESTPGAGAAFTVSLPLAAEEVAAGTSAPSVGSSFSTTLLVIEDEELVRAITCHVLRAAGYRVLEATSGPEAIAQLEAHLDEIEAVVSDVVMAPMSGIETLVRLRELRRGLPCLFVTGFVEEEGNARKLERVSVLEKPFTSNALLASVRELLGHQSA